MQVAELSGQDPLVLKTDWTRNCNTHLILLMSVHWKR